MRVVGELVELCIVLFCSFTNPWYYQSYSNQECRYLDILIFVFNLHFQDYRWICEQLFVLIAYLEIFSIYCWCLLFLGSVVDRYSLLVYSGSEPFSGCVLYMSILPFLLFLIVSNEQRVLRLSDTLVLKVIVFWPTASLHTLESRNFIFKLDYFVFRI